MFKMFTFSQISGYMLVFDKCRKIPPKVGGAKMLEGAWLTEKMIGGVVKTRESAIANLTALVPYFMSFQTL